MNRKTKSAIEAKFVHLDDDDDWHEMMIRQVRVAGVDTSDDLLQSGLSLVEVFSTWCGPAVSFWSYILDIKQEIGGREGYRIVSC
jgi:hypothetical protein